MAKPTLHTVKILVALTGLLLLCPIAWSQYRLNIIPLDKDSTLIIGKAGLQTSFKSRAACEAYIDKLMASLRAKGYAAASIDSIHFDSTEATIQLFTGEAFQVTFINTADIDKRILEQSGWSERAFQNKPLNLE